MSAGRPDNCLQRVEWTGSEIAVDDTEGGKGHRRCCLLNDERGVVSNGDLVDRAGIGVLYSHNCPLTIGEGERHPATLDRNAFPIDDLVAGADLHPSGPDDIDRFGLALVAAGARVDLGGDFSSSFVRHATLAFPKG